VGTAAQVKDAISGVVVTLGRSSIVGPAQYWATDVSDRLHENILRKDGNVNWDIFRAYDIRGVYPNDIRRGSLLSDRKAYAYLFIRRRWLSGGMRGSRRRSAESLISGFVDAGVDVIDIAG